MAENKKPLTAANIKYLLAIQSLCAGQSGVRCTDLARRLNVAKPSVHAMVRSLSEQGLAAKERYGTIFLTEAGQQMAAQYAQCVEDLSSRLQTALELGGEACENAACVLLTQVPELLPQLTRSA